LRPLKATAINEAVGAFEEGWIGDLQRRIPDAGEESGGPGRVAMVARDLEQPVQPAG